MPSLKHLLTIFTTCKPFEGENAVFQDNALATWKHLGAQVFFFGNEAGVEDRCHKMGGRHFKDIQYHASGVPFVDEIFSRGQQEATTPFVCYINADIMLPDKTLIALHSFLSSAAEFSSFLLTSRRINVPLSTRLPEENRALVQHLTELEETHGSWDACSANDIFLFPRGLLTQIPRFLFGRMQWDNWLLWRARDLGAQVIDASEDFHLLHPIHGYGGDGTSWLVRAHSTDAAENRRLAAQQSLTLSQAMTHILRGGILVPASRDIKQDFLESVAPDRQREFQIGLQNLLESWETMTTHEIADYCRTLLWRAGYSFPVLVDTDASREDVQHLLRCLRMSTVADDCARALQDFIATKYNSLLDKALKSNRPIFIWGAGQAGRTLYGELRKKDIIPAGFIDANKTLEDADIDGLPVFSPNKALEKKGNPNMPFVLIASMYAKEISDDLEARGFKLGIDFVG